MRAQKIFRRALGFTKGFPINQIYGGIGHILMFHSVVPLSDKLRISNNFLEVTPEHLEQVILFFIKHEYDIISLDEIHERLINKISSPKFVAFTFDDGYLDNLTLAYPVFKKYNIPFAIYITTNFPDRKTNVWWYPLEEIIRENEILEFHFKGTRYSYNTQSVNEKQEAFVHIRTSIQQCNELERASFLQTIFQQYQIDLRNRTDALILSWEQIKQMSEDPLVTIGGHTVNHYRLGALSEEEARKEILDSVRIIEHNIGKKVEHFSYPFGTKNDVGEREFKIARSLGLKTATTTRPGNIFPGHRDQLHALPRFNVDMTTSWQELDNLKNGLTHFISNRGRRFNT
jgi:peptidoglycan/xylan/chitin deacetylase (PgdA/CDA1 family)